MSETLDPRLEEIASSAFDEIADEFPGEIQMEIPEEEGAAPRPRFVIDTLEKASWALRKIQAIERERLEQEALYRARMEALTKPIIALEAWWAREQAKAQGERAFFEGMLRQYHLQCIEGDPKKKTIKLPEGQLQLREQQPEVLIEGQSDLLTYGQAHLAAIIRHPAPAIDREALKTLESGEVVDTLTGEIIPGLRIQERPAKFSTKPIVED